MIDQVISTAASPYQPARHTYRTFAASNHSATISMSKKIQPNEKNRLHPRNRNRERYDVKALVQTVPELKDYIILSKQGIETVDFSDPEAVRLLNTAILKHYYGIEKWDFPKENLCPPIPGRADYIHYIADLLAEHNSGKIPKGEKVTGFDVGTGAGCIYPIIGTTEYGWKFVATEIDNKSLRSAQHIAKINSSLTDKIEFRRQGDPNDVFFGVWSRLERVDFTMCNPPFHASAEEAMKGSRRKVANLSGKKVSTPERNFSGAPHELITEGGEIKFIQNMVKESTKFGKNCLWFSTIVSKQSNLKKVEEALKRAKALQTRIIPMGTGNKSSRLMVWSFLSKAERKQWREERW
jgi:23S rRNA (adenine1618-N6)-methyltransferase